ncbi:hypothetical protein [Collimonas humicola]|uniref:hypothetical protein n=1 Tax=Collimonas humicola TaxID=2825886 RepID=UPI001B8C5A15|nr:hypothetical protein [Collimonas humicola]
MNDSVNFRRTALLLHAMSAADRNWMLTRLGGAVQTSLNGMLDELAALGIPADRDLLSRAAESTAPARHAAMSAADPVKLDAGNAAEILRADPLAHAIAALKNATPASLAQVLKEEPPELIARLLACHAWSWREDLLEQLGQARRLQVERFAHAFSGSAPRLTEILLDSLASRLKIAPAVKQGSNSASEKNIGSRTVPTSWFKKIGHAFKLHRQFSSLKRGAR